MKKANVILTQKTAKKFSFCLSKAKNRYEIGGLLIGYQIYNVFFVIDITYPQKPNENTLTSFTLDSREHIPSAIKASQEFFIPPKIIGSWHSHICDFQFSEQDITSSKTLAEYLDGALSILILPSKRIFGCYFQKSKSYLPATFNFISKRKRGTL